MPDSPPLAPEMVVQRPRVRVALIIESSRVYGRGLLRGIASFARTKGDWSTFFEPRAPRDPLPPWLRTWKGDAIIARIETRAMASAILRHRLPTVDLRGLFTDLPVPLVETDDQLVPRLAFDHLMDRGFRRVAFVGFARHNYSETRCAAFTAIAQKAGVPCAVYNGPARSRSKLPSRQLQHGIVCERDLPRWLAAQPKPIGVMACNDVRGQQVLSACRDANLAVPDEVAVIGVDNDEVLCELADPPLSSVIPHTVRIGEEAAALVEQMIAGDIPRSRRVVYVPPVGVASRRSTDVLALDDRVLAAAVRLIRGEACSGLRVEDIIARLPISRSSLERKFRAAFDRSPHDEILHVRLLRVRQLLTDTDMKLAQIASIAGFEHAEYMSVVFRRETGETPGAFRGRTRSGEVPSLLTLTTTRPGSGSKGR
jgi:LacI family transcriptional regulator